MTEFKDTIHILREPENHYFLIDEKVIESELNSHATLLDLARFLNANEYEDIEFWINNNVYHLDDNIRLIDLGFNPKINIIEIAKREYTLYNSPELNCDRFYGDRTILEKRTVRFNLYSISKIIYVWESYFENLEKIEQDLSTSFNFRKNITNNKYEIDTVEQICNESIELIEKFMVEIKRKLKKIE